MAGTPARRRTQGRSNRLRTRFIPHHCRQPTGSRGPGQATQIIPPILSQRPGPYPGGGRSRSQPDPGPGPRPGGHRFSQTTRHPLPTSPGQTPRPHRSAVAMLKRSRSSQDSSLINNKKTMTRYTRHSKADDIPVHLRLTVEYWTSNAPCWMSEHLNERSSSEPWEVPSRYSLS